ncbi:DeoR/GlpR family DNA-binding transcription regulator [Salipaludibacillus sp. HK11]|uniref:DeoR/GlpR family DNA-binding transcription regulator n=1 Tax=Salipaludibacillus sp. HK11 TaxID=3394320 RepID=UPI0039FBDBAC
MKLNESKTARRHKKIISLLHKERKVKVTSLSAELNVTEETIRRDLESLENENMLIRVRGGAISKQPMGSETPLLEREKNNLVEKQALANEALQIIEEGEIIAIDASTTSLQLARVLPNFPLTVITNSIHVAVELSQKEQIKVILSGGYLRTESMSLVGVSSDKIINDYHIDKYFISCTGIHHDWGVSDSHELQGQTKGRIAELSEKIIVLADHSKFNHRSLLRWLMIDQIHTLITSDIVEDDTLNLYKQSIKHVRVTKGN